MGGAIVEMIVNVLCDCRPVEQRRDAGVIESSVTDAATFVCSMPARLRRGPRRCWPPYTQLATRLAVQKAQSVAADTPVTTILSLRVIVNILSPR
jgi:hypothetical protein